MLPNPCPCTTLQCGVKVVAICYTVGHLFSILIYILLLGVSDALDSFLLLEFQASFLTSHTILIVLLICYIIALGLDIVLYLGAQKRNVTMCWAWLGFMLLVFLYEVINSILQFSGYYSAIPGEDLVTHVFLRYLDCVPSICLCCVCFHNGIRNQPDPQLNPAFKFQPWLNPGLRL
ncbi:Gustatory receptor 10a [Orchesella cincta]|uniref:Gustatory receptor 10a n=1 Tax=Orchesella cincta TaxID=48709 RepID=A0A1D2M3U9_ORCCI|nr:Gustatory receptor 10a [Orchesella cincta]